MKIKIRLDIDPCELQFDSGDPEMDWVKEILDRVKRGDEWAWFDATVTASAKIGNYTFIGRDHLGACSYRDEKDFKGGDYYRDMCNAAVADLKAGIISMFEQASTGMLELSKNDPDEIEEE